VSARASNDRVVVLGGGANGLAAAVYLAKRGRAVTLLEARDVLGGLAAAETFHPGYSAPGIHLHTAGVRRFALEATGIELPRAPRAELVLPSRDGSEIRVKPADPTAGALSGNVDDADREAWCAFQAFIAKVRPVAERWMDAPPLGVKDSLWSLLRSAIAVRRLGRETMIELLRIAPMCVADWMRDAFRSERLRAGMCLPAVAGSFTGPWSAHTALLLLLHEALATEDVVGGAAAVTRALEDAARRAGVEVRTACAAEKILVDRGRVTGVRVAGGEELSASAVLSTLDPKQTFLGLVGPPHLPLELGDAARVYRMRGSTAVVRLALSGPLETRAGTRPAALRTGDTLDEIERGFDAAKYRRFAEAPALDVRVPSMTDASLCPAGHAVVTILAHSAAHDLDGGWNDRARKGLRDAVVGALAGVCPTVRDRIVGSDVLAPPDLEARYRLRGGHLLHGEHAPDQFFSFRPSLSSGRYATPIPGLYLGGGGSHPGGGLHLAAGVLAAKGMLG
jgi:phytoene dehydrogenase-like protein